MSCTEARYCSCIVFDWFKAIMIWYIWGFHVPSCLTQRVCVQQWWKIYDLLVSGMMIFFWEPTDLNMLWNPEREAELMIVLCIISLKSYMVMLVNVSCFFLWLCGCACAGKISHVLPATGWASVNSPPGASFHFLGKEPHSSSHIWLLCTYYSQWSNRSGFAHSDQQLHNVFIWAYHCMDLWLFYFFPTYSLCTSLSHKPVSIKITNTPTQCPSSGDKCLSLISITV